MLLFIGGFEIEAADNMEFQYISCYCLSLQRRKEEGIVKYFNTSHVTVYLCLFKEYGIACFISIHLMLLFIFAFSKNPASLALFQYISCYCLSKSSRRVHIPNLISIHLMLLFIVFLHFHYCTYLHFNTSHVTVYPVARQYAFY